MHLADSSLSFVVLWSILIPVVILHGPSESCQAVDVALAGTMPGHGFSQKLVDPDVNYLGQTLDIHSLIKPSQIAVYPQLQGCNAVNRDLWIDLRASTIPPTVLCRLQRHASLGLDRCERHLVLGWHREHKNGAVNGIHEVNGMFLNSTLTVKF